MDKKTSLKGTYTANLMRAKRNNNQEKIEKFTNLLAELDDNTSEKTEKVSKNLKKPRAKSENKTPEKPEKVLTDFDKVKQKLKEISKHEDCQTAVFVLEGNTYNADSMNALQALKFEDCQFIKNNFRGQAIPV